MHGMWWNAAGSDDHVTVLMGDAELYLWDVGQRRCVGRWKDEGGFRSAGRALAGTTAGNGYLAVGFVSPLISFLLLEVHLFLGRTRVS
jgi:U3 small nucleolar RNA-associated protein 18